MIVQGTRPTRRFYLIFGITVIIDRYVEDGWGYGAGGGEDNRSGYNGVAVFIICK